MFEVNGHIVEQNDKGQWIWKAKESVTNPPLKIKPQHNERPEFPLIETIENKSKLRYQKQLGNLVVDIAKFLKQQTT